jgi:prepilin-type N-terminal cleavage/methylation domain-containing protein
MKSLHTRRIGFDRRGRDRGFSMIELMVVLAVVAALGVVAAVGFRRNEFANQRARFIADCEGILVQARNAAVDRQTRVRVIVDALSITLTSFETETNTWVLVDRVALEQPNGSLVTQNDAVCIYGFTPGVQAPSQATAVDPPTDCLANPQTLVFEPDGRFSDPDAVFSAVPNAGATLWIVDRTLTAQPKYSILQIFPGGLVRTFEQLD